MKRNHALTALFAACAFLSSFLLFLIEPLQGKMLLPLFGGAPGVWNTCMVFFQALLLVGYLYAHVLAKKVALTRQLLVQGLLLALPVAFLPITLPNIVVQFEWLAESPLRWLLIVLAATSGPAFLVVATASPLLQSWYFRATESEPEAASPYVLYAAGNTGSLLALVAYPLVIEPNLRLMQQSWLWTGGYALLCTLFAAVGVCIYKRRPRPAPAVVALPPATEEDDGDFFDEAAHYLKKSGFDPLHPDDDADLEPKEEFGFDTMEEWDVRGRRASAGGVTAADRLRWIGLAFIPSSLMLGVTTYMTTDIASIPLLWTVPLLLYILSFAIVFWRYPASLDRALAHALPALLISVVFLTFADYRQNIGILIAIHLTAFLAAALVCHGRLAQARPEPRHLTAFYFWLSLGGVLGGLFNSMVAPLVFSSVAEYPLMLAASVALHRATKARAQSLRDVPWVIGACAAGAFLMTQMIHLYRTNELDFVSFQLRSVLVEEVTRSALTYGIPLIISFVFFFRPLRQAALVLGIAIVALAQDIDTTTLFQSRSFYGVLKVRQYESSQTHALVHGGILHGEQRMADPEERRTPRSYYHPDGPLGQIIATVSEHRPHPKIGAIGLGTGALAAYGTQDNEITFYEINPNVERVARDPSLFTYVDDCLKRWCHLSVVIGDGRLKLLESSETYDVIVVDAFSSDAIPVHLITIEAMQAYVQHLNPGGIIAFHISNRYVNLEPVILNQAKEMGLGYGVRADDGDEASGRGASVWAVVAAQNGPFDVLTADGRWRGLEGKDDVGIWADDYANVLKTFTWY